MSELCPLPNNASLHTALTKRSNANSENYLGTFAYQGCYTEGSSGRALSDNSAVNNMTIEQCASYCQGYTYMGTEYSNECEHSILALVSLHVDPWAGYCGNAINTGSTIADASGCSMTCSGDGTELCGGPNRLSFYKVKPTGPSVVQKAGAFSFQSCYTEATNSWALSAKNTAASTMTVEMCSTFCTGYTMMGVEYGQECKRFIIWNIHRYAESYRLLWKQLECWLRRSIRWVLYDL